MYVQREKNLEKEEKKKEEEEEQQNARFKADRWMSLCFIALFSSPRPSFCHVQRIMHDFAARVASGEGRQTHTRHRTTARGIRGDFTRTIVNTGSATTVAPSDRFFAFFTRSLIPYFSEAFLIGSLDSTMNICSIRTRGRVSVYVCCALRIVYSYIFLPTLYYFFSFLFARVEILTLLLT